MKRLLLVALLMGMALVVRANNPYNIPYIYYYDDYLKGTIIERTDGTDSRFVPYHHVEWSPSGQWFVGSTGEGARWSQTDNPVGEKKYRVRSDGTQPVEIFEQTSRYDYRHKFAPHHDVLAIFDTIEVWTGNNRRWDALMRLVDFSTGEVVASMDISDFDTDYLYPNADRIYWQVNGLNAFFDIGKTVVRVGVDGSVLFHSKLDYYGKFIEAYDKGFTLRPSGQTHTSFDFIDHVSGQEFSFNDTAHVSHEGYTSKYQMIWNDQRTYGLITGTSCNQQECEPSQTWLVKWPHKQIRLLPESVTIIQDEIGRPSVAFSPNGLYAFYTNQPLVIDLETQQMTSLQVDDLSSWTWSSENILALSGGYMDTAKTILFDPTTGLVSESSFNSHQVFPSPDGTKWGLLTLPPVIKDQSGNIIRQWLPHSHSTHSYQTPERYQWHPNGEWVIGEYMIFFAGGGTGPLAGTVFDMSGTVNRELPTDGNAHFVPENVIPHLLPGQLTSFKADPVFETAAEDIYMWGDNTSVGWNPADPNLFVIYGNGELNYWRLSPELKRFNQTVVDFATLGTSIATNYRFDLLKESAENECLTASGGAYEATVILRRTDTGEEITRLWTTGALVAFSDDERWLLTVSEHKIQLWDVSGYCS